MALNALGYIGLTSDRLDDWAACGSGLLGLDLAERTSGTLKFRMDDRKQRIIVSNSEVAGATSGNVYGWEVDDAAALDDLAARLEKVKIKVKRMARHDLALRCVTDGIAFCDPAGTRHEAFIGPEVADTPFTTGRPISGFRTGPLGMGHVVLTVDRVEDLQWFYEDVLGFRLSDFTLAPFKAFFFHLNPRHHSLAMIETGSQGIHHIMMELKNLDDVGQGYDIAMQQENRIATTLGRHTNDLVTSFYANSPDEFMVEYGWGGRIIDPETWQPYEMDYGPSLWGHERSWLPPDDLERAKQIRAKAAADGLCQPVQVDAGNYNSGVTTCAWWEQAKKQH